MLEQAHSINETLVSLRHEFHRHPELGFEEHRSAQLIADRLAELGLTPRTGVAKTGVVAEVGEHPLKKMIQAGLNPTINTDDPAISGITLGSEYALIIDQIGLTQAELQGRINSAAEAAFIPAGEREKLAATLGGIS